MPKTCNSLKFRHECAALRLSANRQNSSGLKTYIRGLRIVSIHWDTWPLSRSVALEIREWRIVGYGCPGAGSRQRRRSTTFFRKCFWTNGNLNKHDGYDSGEFPVNLSSANVPIAEGVDEDAGSGGRRWNDVERIVVVFIAPWDPSCQCIMSGLKERLEMEGVKREKVQENMKRLHRWMQGVVMA